MERLFPCRIARRRTGGEPDEDHPSQNRDVLHSLPREPHPARSEDVYGIRESTLASKTKRPGRCTQAGAWRNLGATGSDLRDFCRLGALGTLRDLEADFVSFVQGLVPVSHNLAKVDEDIVARFTGDETVAFGSVEPLYCSLFHGTDPFR
jgi:hypothetical protein